MGCRNCSAIMAEPLTWRASKMCVLRFHLHLVTLKLQVESRQICPWFEMLRCECSLKSAAIFYMIVTWCPFVMEGGYCFAISTGRHSVYSTLLLHAMLHSYNVGHGAKTAVSHWLFSANHCRGESVTGESGHINDRSCDCLLPDIPLLNKCVAKSLSCRHSETNEHCECLYTSITIDAEILVFI